MCDNICMNDMMMDKNEGDMNMMDDGRDRTDMMDGGLYGHEKLSLEKGSINNRY